MSRQRTQGSKTRDMDNDRSLIPATWMANR